MSTHFYRYQFSPPLDIAEVEATVTLAILATESLHGDSRVRLEARHKFDAQKRLCVIDDNGEVGRDFNRIFLGFMTREFGRDSFQVEHALAPTSSSSVPAA
jgi:hypothetical protein